MIRKEQVSIYFKIMFTIALILCLFVASLGQDKGKTSINEAINKADELLEAESKICVIEGKKICEQLLKDGRVKVGSMEEGYLYERIAFADSRTGRGINWNHYKKALSIYEKVGSQVSRMRRAMILSELSQSYNNKFCTEEERKEGIRYLMEALNIIKKAPAHTETQASILSQLAEQYYELGKERIFLKDDQEALEQSNKTVALSYLKTALEYDKKALILYEKVRDFSGQSTTLSNLGWDYLMINSDSKTVAVNYLKKAIELSRKSNDKGAEIRALMSFGQFYSYTKDTMSAESYYNEALNASKQSNDKEWEQKIYWEFMKLYEDVDEEKAASYEKLYRKLDTELETKDCVFTETIK